jgi:hypothetical protein
VYCTVALEGQYQQRPYVLEYNNLCWNTWCVIQTRQTCKSMRTKKYDTDKVLLLSSVMLSRIYFV